MSFEYLTHFYYHQLRQIYDPASRSEYWSDLVQILLFMLRALNLLCIIRYSWYSFQAPFDPSVHLLSVYSHLYDETFLLAAFLFSVHLATIQALMYLFVDTESEIAQTNYDLVVCSTDIYRKCFLPETELNRLKHLKLFKLSLWLETQFGSSSFVYKLLNYLNINNILVNLWMIAKLDHVDKRRMLHQKLRNFSSLSSKSRIRLMQLLILSDILMVITFVIVGKSFSWYIP